MKEVKVERVIKEILYECNNCGSLHSRKDNIGECEECGLEICVDCDRIVYKKDDNSFFSNIPTPSRRCWNCSNS